MAGSGSSAAQRRGLWLALLLGLSRVACTPAEPAAVPVGTGGPKPVSPAVPSDPSSAADPEAQPRISAAPSSSSSAAVSAASSGGAASSPAQGGTQAELTRRCAEPCAELGRCEYANGSCVARRSEDCAASKICALRGLCERSGDGCVATTQAHCAQAEDCKRGGMCSLGKAAWAGQCVATANADCRRAEVCKDHGHCSARDGACIAASNHDCRGSKACADQRYCAAHAGGCIYRCRNQDDCGSASRCAGGGCVPSSAICKDHPMCRWAGRCGSSSQRCQPVLATDCANTLVCNAGGCCKAVAGSCVHPTEPHSCMNVLGDVIL